MNICAVYCADGTYVNEPTKYIATSLTSISTMVQMSVPHLNILTKCDKIQNKELLEMLTSSNSVKEILEDLGHTSEKQFFTSKFKKLNELLVGVIDGFSLVNY
jgi:GPN-loop GTPase